MTSFFWSQGHLGWPFFGVLVYSVLCLLAGDIVWRLTPAPFRKIFAVMAVIWVAGAVALIALW
ncbi:MAG TPA: hypothetical protein VJL61_08740 [Rhodanobacteraceae bacterium]|nr:hypothetical protein [Rhodanobacteraceae bacterium]